MDYDEWYNKDEAMPDKIYNWLFDHSIEDERVKEIYKLITLNIIDKYKDK